MKNYIEYNGESLKITAQRAIEIEDKLGAGIIEKMNNCPDQVGVLSTIIAGAIQQGSYDERQKKAISFFDDMIDEGKSIVDYQILVFEVLVTAGFMSGEELKVKKLILQSQKMLLAENLKKATELNNTSAK